LAYIPKAILEKIRKSYFRFLWARNDKNKGTNLVKWKDIARTKEEGAWALKNIHMFGKSLVASGLWNILTKESL
jgi:hypothetical protein